MDNRNNISNGANKKIRQILDDIYKVDSGLRLSEQALVKIIEEMLEAKPDTQFDENFSRELRAEIIRRALVLQETKKEKSFFAKLFTARRFVYAFGGAALVILLALPLAYKYYQGQDLAFIPGISTGGKIDDWQYNSSKLEAEKPQGFLNSVSKQITGNQSFGLPSAPGMKMNESSDALGFATGGAKDVNNFRKNIENNYLPLPTDITYEGLFYDYYFDTAKKEQCDKLFCPSYSYAISADPFSQKDEYYLSVGLNSNIKESDFARKKLNLVVVLDISGSMGSPFNRYYYDQFGGKQENTGAEDDYRKKKIEIAAQSVVGLLSHLKDDDRFGMVLYDDQAVLAKPLDLVGNTDMQKIKDHLLEIQERGGTQMSAGMRMGTDQFSEAISTDQNEYENRIIFLTDAMPNIGETSENGLLGMLKKNAANKIYTTFIGIGVDFNTKLVDYITKIRGANYYSVHSAADFKKRMDDEFEFMVTPLVFNLTLKLDAKGYEIEKVYGSPEANEATGEIMKVNTLFPSSTENGETKGGIVLLKLKKISDDANLTLKASYEDRTGKTSASEANISFAGDKEIFENNGIRKGVLLARYADLMKNWINDERRNYNQPEYLMPSVSKDAGIIVPPVVQLGQWERQSVPLRVSSAYKELFGEFKKYFEKEMNVFGDDTLKQEITILEKLEK